jgi:hypothetical protein
MRLTRVQKETIALAETIVLLSCVRRQMHIPNIIRTIFVFHRTARFTHTCVVDDPIIRVDTEISIIRLLKAGWNEMRP